MLICSSVDEVKRRESALKFISTHIAQGGRENLFDLSGLAGGFPLKHSDLDLLETYAGHALFSESLQKEGIQHLGGEKVLAFNRTSSAILATILALVKPGEEVIHYLPKLPSHPSIPRSAKLQGASYSEYDNIDEFKLGDKTSLVVITGSTMDHQIIPVSDFKQIIEIAHDSNVPVLVDDASGARLRTVIYNQPKGLDMGADLAVTSTDKLMDGPRAGLMSGNSELIDIIQEKAHQFGLEAQPPIVAGIVRALEDFDPQRMLDSLKRKEEIFPKIADQVNGVEMTPTGFMITADNLIDIFKNEEIGIELEKRDIATLMAMVLLKEHYIVTIPAAGMPSVSPTIRLDLSAKDAQRLTDKQIIDAMTQSLNRVAELISSEDSCLKVIFGE